MKSAENLTSYYGFMNRKTRFSLSFADAYSFTLSFIIVTGARTSLHAALHHQFYKSERLTYYLWFCYISNIAV